MEKPYKIFGICTDIMKKGGEPIIRDGKKVNGAVGWYRVVNPIEKLGGDVAIGTYVMMECGADQVLVEDAYFVITENFASSESAAHDIVAIIPGVGTMGMNEVILCSQLTTTEIRVFAQRYPDDDVTWATVNSFPVILQPGWQIGFRIATGAITAGAGKLVVKIAKSFV